ILGFPVLDAGGAPITLNPTGGPPMIFRDGMINQGDSQVGALGLFEIDDSTPLRRGENSSVIPAAPATPVVNFTRNGVVQGHVENANVNPVTEITKLILTQRAFEGAVGAYDLMDNAHRNAVKTLGGA
ncbi:MAG: flagellar biosynthesis protein FlgF, partial [Methylocystis sp.]|nr:flagellar biosynthesis protein FlgF [Methylocystis sp.]